MCTAHLARVFGRRKDSSLLCLLFNFVLECVVRRFELYVGGRILNSSVQILTYTDDIDFVSRSYVTVRDAFFDLEKAVSRVSLMVNQAKIRVHNYWMNVNMKHTLRWVYIQLYK